MPALTVMIGEMFDVQFLHNLFDVGPQQRVAGVTVSTANLIALKSAVTKDAREACLHLDCNPRDQGVRALVTSALGNAWNGSRMRADLELPPWPWR